MKRKSIVIGFLLLFALNSIIGQVPSNYLNLSEEYPVWDYIFLNSTYEIHLNVVKDSIDYSCNYISKVYCTTDKCSKFYKRSVETSSFRTLNDIEAYTLFTDNNKDKYKKSKVKDFESIKAISSSVFYDDNQVTSFEYKNMRKGSICYLSYSVNVLYPQLTTTTFFEHSVPMLENQLVLHVDNDIDVNVFYFNMDDNEVDYTVEKNKNETIHSWKRKNIEPYEEEEYCQDDRYILPHIIIGVNSYKTKDGETKFVLRNVEDLYKWYKSLINKVDYNNLEEIEEVLSKIIEDTDSEIDKVKKVYKWVQDNIKYIAMTDGLGGFIPNNPSVIMSRRYGDCKDMSVLIKTMLDVLEIDSYLSWVGSRDIPYTYSELPTPAVDNHMIVSYYEAGSEKLIFLDATNSFLNYGLPSQMIQGKEVLIDHGESFKIAEAPIVEPNVNGFYDSVLLEIANDSLIGTGNIIGTGYFNNDFLYSLSKSIDKKDVKYFIDDLTSKGNNKFNLTQYEIKDDVEDFICTYEFVLEDYFRRNNNEIYVNLNMSKFFDSYRKIDDDRETAIENEFKKTISLHVELKIPDGYNIKYIPENSEYRGDKFSFSLDYFLEDNLIKYDLKITLNYLVLEKEYFNDINEMFANLKDAYKENVILERNN